MRRRRKEDLWRQIQFSASAFDRPAGVALLAFLEFGESLRMNAAVWGRREGERAALSRCVQCPKSLLANCFLLDVAPFSFWFLSVTRLQACNCF